MLLAALGGGALHYSGLATEIQAGGFIVEGIFLAYLTWRWAAAWRRLDRWKEVQRHRAELEDWARERKKHLRQTAEASDSLPPER